MNREKKLTIVIPTYNRAERLVRQVRAIVSDPDYDKVILRITDNHSPYDVRQMLRETFTEEQYGTLDIVVRPYNVGLGLNIALPFIECQTPWVWILGDDDRFVGKLSQLLEDIETYSECAFIKYNISNGRKNDEKEISSIDEFMRYYTDLHPTGDLVFISNALFNLLKLEKYRQLAVVQSHTLVGHLIPLVQALCDGKTMCRFRDYDLVEYQSAPAGTEYGKLGVTMGIANVGDIKFVEGYAKNKRIHEMFQWDVKQSVLVDTLMQHHGRRYRRYCYRRIQSVFYSDGGGYAAFPHKQYSRD